MECAGEEAFSEVPALLSEYEIYMVVVHIRTGKSFESIGTYLLVVPNISNFLDIIQPQIFPSITCLQNFT